jgi:hypothetical protein
VGVDRIPLDPKPTDQNAMKISTIFPYFFDHFKIGSASKHFGLIESTRSRAKWSNALPISTKRIEK